MKTIVLRLHVQFYVLYSTTKLRINVDHRGVAKPTNKCGSEGVCTYTLYVTLCRVSIEIYFLVRYFNFTLWFP